MKIFAPVPSISESTGGNKDSAQEESGTAREESATATESGERGGGETARESGGVTNETSGDGDITQSGETGEAVQTRRTGPDGTEQTGQTQHTESTGETEQKGSKSEHEDENSEEESASENETGNSESDVETRQSNLDKTSATEYVDHDDSEDSRASSSRPYGRDPPKPWISRRFCDYPVELGLVFNGLIRLKQLQVLTHENRIPTKMEIFIGKGFRGVQHVLEEKELDDTVEKFFKHTSEINNANALSSPFKEGRSLKLRDRHAEIETAAKSRLQYYYERKIDWGRLGYLTLDSNQRSHYEAKELKSVYLDHKSWASVSLILVRFTERCVEAA